MFPLRFTTVILLAVVNRRGNNALTWDEQDTSQVTIALEVCYRATALDMQGIHDSDEPTSGSCGDRRDRGHTTIGTR